MLLSQFAPRLWLPPGEMPARPTRMRMSWGLLGSALLHILVALLLIYGLPRPVPPSETDLAIPIDLVQAGAPTESPPMPKQGPIPAAAPEPVPQAQPAPQAEAPTPPAPTPSENGPRIDPRADITPARKPPALIYGSSDRLAAIPSRPTPTQLLPLTEPESAGQPSDTTSLGNDPNARGPATYDVKDAIRAQIERRWNFDVDALGSSNLTVAIHIAIEPDGTVDTADIVADPSHAGDPIYRALAISARDAVLVSSPLRLPPGAYAGHADMVLRFSPHDVLR